MANITPILPIPGACGAVETDRVATVAACAEAGMPSKHIFLHTDALARGEIIAARGKCRYLVASPAALSALDAALDDALAAGYLEPVGLCIGPEGFSREVPALSAAMRRTKNLTLRYVFLSLPGSGDLSAAAREGFSFIKRLRADVPCMLHGFCLRGLLKPLEAGDAKLSETLQMLAALNDSSLYAEFFID